MDCEKFDRVVLDLLYDELDELTNAAAKRHMEHCTRCRNIGAGLRATREVGALPLVEPPEGLELRILEAERKIGDRLPLRQRVGRAISIMASYAMRPQLAMAALLLLMIGSSLLLLRERSSERDAAHVAERGVPENESETVAIVPITPKEKAAATPPPAAPAAMPRPEAEKLARRDKSSEERAEAKGAGPKSARAALEELESEPALGRMGTGESASGRPVGALDQAAAPEGESDFGAAMSAYRDGRYAEAQQRFDEIATRGGDRAPEASLYAAQALRHTAGCPAAAPRFEQVHGQNVGSHVGNEAAWQAAECHRALGNVTRARHNYQLLLTATGYADRAQAALNEMEQTGVAVASRKARAKEAPPAAAAPPPANAARRAPAKASKPAATVDSAY